MPHHSNSILIMDTVLDNAEYEYVRYKIANYININYLIFDIIISNSYIITCMRLMHIQYGQTKVVTFPDLM